MSLSVGNGVSPQETLPIRWKGRFSLLFDKGKHVGNAAVVIDSNEAVAVARLRGRFDMDSSPAVRIRLLGLLETAHLGSVAIDLAAVTHIDSSGIATLIEALKVARLRQVELRLQGLHDQLLRLFEVTGVRALFEGGARA
jgi:anti-sigma B factor antagonist